MFIVITFILFTALVAVIAAVKTREENLDTQDGYFLAGRSLTGPVIAGSLMLTNLSTEQLVGQKVALAGWVDRRRDHGGVAFIDLRDSTGLVQVVIYDEDMARPLRSEFVIQITGEVRLRTDGNENTHLATGKIEVVAESIEVLAKSDALPFQVSTALENESENKLPGEDVRLKYRYLDLRRPSMQHNLKLRSDMAKAARHALEDMDFTEVETPTFIKSTPEGARDFVVPARLVPGSWYALPQSPQLLKQLLMVSGVERYYQLARCYRDEDFRADRQPEFTQLDMEMAYVDQEDVMAMTEKVIAAIWKSAGYEVQLPLPRITWKDAMDKYGSDKPDLRFGYEIVDISDIAKDCSFKVFKGAVEDGGTVRLININGGADKFPRKEIDKLQDFVKTYRAKGLAWMKLAADGKMTSSFAKFLSEDEIEAIKAKAQAKDGDLLFVVADSDWQTAVTALGALRCELAKRLGVIDPHDYKLLWVVEFPQFEYSEEENRYVAMHHPFTAPMDEDLDILESDPAKVRAKPYDIILNGCELGGGSIRIHSTETQARMFRALGFSDEDAQERFGHLLTAFKYGAPPHGGLAYGLDRLCMLLAGLDSIRDVIAFPKVQNASDLMMNCPDIVDDKQLDDLSIAVTRVEEEPQASLLIEKAAVPENTAALLLSEGKRAICG